MENSECNPTVEAVVESLKTKTIVDCKPGICRVCNRQLPEAYHVVDNFKWPIFACDKASELYEEAKAKAMIARGENEWHKQCPALYRNINPTLRQRYKRIDWAKYDLAIQWRPGDKGLFLFGDSGSGKSTALWHLLKSLCEIGTKWAIFSGKELSERYFAAVKTNEVDLLTKQLVDIPLLALDDFGKDVISEGVSSFLFDLMNQRFEQLKPIIGTTRFNSKTLPERFAAHDRTKGEDLSRRIQDYCKIYAFIDQTKTQEELNI